MNSLVTPLIVRFPLIELFLTDQGFSPPPPTSVTFPLTVMPLIRTVSAPAAVMFPLTVMVELPVGSMVQACRV